MLMGKNGLAIVVLGPPGAGKGTQARKLSDALKLPHVSTGDMLREWLKNPTEPAKEAQKFMDSGALVPDALVDAIVAERLGREDCSKGCILDGYPRTIAQAQVLQTLLDKKYKKVLAIGIKIEDSVLIQRLSVRWTCPKCGKVYNAQFETGKRNNRCDECFEDLVQRKDDTEEVVAKRLQVYHKNTLPLILYYQGQGAYKDVNGDQPVDQVFDNIRNLITNYEFINR
jgi:adenylate kinase